MSNKTVKYIYLIYGILLSALLIVTGILLMISCVSIYKIGNRPFTTENISAAFAKIAVPVWITVGAVIIGIILKLALPTEKGKLKAIKDKKITLSRLQSKIDVNSCAADALASIKKEQKLRLILRIAAVVLSALAALPALIYVFDFENFTMDYNASVISACYLILPCTFVAMGICLAFVFIENASVERQLKAVKAAIAKAKGASAPSVKEPKPNKALTSGIRIAIAVVALVLIVMGILNGGMADVLSKAINICTECIGLG